MEAEVSKVGEYLTLLEELYSEAELAFGKLPVDTANKSEMILASLYASIFAFADTAIFLLRNDREAGLSAIGRSTLEAWVDLKNLASDPAYLDKMEASYFFEYIRMLDDGVAGNNPYSAGFANNPQVTQRLADFKTQLAKLESNGVKPMNIRAKFDKVGMLNAYTSVYNTLCSEGHNNIRALQDRHFEVTDGKLGVAVFKTQLESHLLAMIDLFVDPMLSGIAILYKKQDLPLPESVKKVEERLDAFRSAL